MRFALQCDSDNPRWGRLDDWRLSADIEIAGLVHAHPAAARQAYGIDDSIAIAPSWDELLAATTNFEAIVIEGGSLACLKAMADRQLPTLIHGSLLSATTALESISASARANIRVAREWRSASSATAVKESISSGKLGELGLVRLHQWEARDGEASSDERLAELLDVVCWLFARPPLEVYSLQREFGQGGYRQIHLGFGDGGMALLDQTTTLAAGKGYVSLSAIGADGAAYADDHHNQQLILGGVRAAASRTPSASDGMIRQLLLFAKHRDGHAELASWNESLIVARTLQAARDSAETKRVAQLVDGRYELV